MSEESTTPDLVEFVREAVTDFRDGRISRLRSYFDHDEALKAVGLAE